MKEKREIKNLPRLTVPDVRLSDPLVTLKNYDLAGKKVKVPKVDPVVYYGRGEKFFKTNRVGRFLSGRTKAGRVGRRVVYGVLGVALSKLGIDTGNLELIPDAVNALEPAVIELVDSLNNLAITISGILASIILILDKIQAGFTTGAERNAEASSDTTNQNP